MSLKFALTKFPVEYSGYSRDISPDRSRRYGTIIYGIWTRSYCCTALLCKTKTTTTKNSTPTGSIAPMSISGRKHSLGGVSLTTRNPCLSVFPGQLLMKIAIPCIGSQGTTSVPPQKHVKACQSRQSTLKHVKARQSRQSTSKHVKARQSTSKHVKAR